MSAHLVNDGGGLFFQHIGRGKKQHRVEITLYRHPRAEDFPRSGHLHTPIHADDIAARRFDERQHAAGVGAEMNQRHTGFFGAGDGFSAVGQHIFPVIGGRQRAHPTVEELQHLRARFSLCEKVFAHQCGKFVQQRMPRGGVAVHQAFGANEIAR